MHAAFSWPRDSLPLILIQDVSNIVATYENDNTIDKGIDMLVNIVPLIIT